MNSIVWLRGFWTAFGHPAFTMMTGFGIAVALRTHSKVVRILAPLVGYLAAAFLHMSFNSLASFDLGTMQYIIYFGVVVPLVISAVVYVIRLILAEGRRIRSRLADYVLLGWLPEVDLQVQPKLRLRLWAGMVGVTRGVPVLLATLRLQRTLTELAYLRDGECGVSTTSRDRPRTAAGGDRQGAAQHRNRRSPWDETRAASLAAWETGILRAAELPGAGGNRWELARAGGTPGGVSHSTVDPNWGHRGVGGKAWA